MEDKKIVVTGRFGSNLEDLESPDEICLIKELPNNVRHQTTKLKTIAKKVRIRLETKASC